ncbi:MAG: RNA pseudouridine synthase, partial [Desulfuromonas sp.]
HSHRLRFFHPVTRTDCRLTAPLPPDLTRFIDSLDADRSSF